LFKGINTPENQRLFNELSAIDLNYLLFSCEQEEWERNGHGTYSVPNEENLVYAGFASHFTPVHEASLQNNLWIPLFQNMMIGNWILDFHL